MGCPQSVFGLGLSLARGSPIVYVGTFATPSVATMSYPSLQFQVHNGLAMVTVNRPDKLNALNAQVIGDLAAVVDEIRRAPEITAVVLTGAGNRAFVAGADIGEFQGLDSVAARQLSI